MSLRRCQTFDIVAMQADGFCRMTVLGLGPPYLDSDVRRGRNEGGIALREDDIIHPVCMGLYEVPEGAAFGIFLAFGRRVLGGIKRVGGRRGFALVLVEVEVEVPSAYNAVSSSGVTGYRLQMNHGLKLLDLELTGSTDQCQQLDRLLLTDGPQLSLRGARHNLFFGEPSSPSEASVLMKCVTPDV